MTFIDEGYTPYFERRALSRSGTSAFDYDSLFEDESIITAKIGGRSVTASKLALAVIITELLADGAVTNAKIESISANKVTAGEFVAPIDVGDPTTGYVRIDGPNNRIVIHDGNTTRIVIGDV